MHALAIARGRNLQEDRGSTQGPGDRSLRPGHRPTAQPLAGSHYVSLCLHKCDSSAQPASQATGVAEPCKIMSVMPFERFSRMLDVCSQTKSLVSFLMGIKI